MATDERAPEPINLWPNKRIIFLAIVIGLIFYAVFTLPATINYLLLRARDIVIMLVLSVAAAYFLLPTVKLLERLPGLRSLPARRNIATLLSMMLVVLAFVLLVVLISQPVGVEMSRLATQTAEWVKTLPTVAQDWLDRYSDRIPPQWQLWIEQQLSAEHTFGPPGEGQGELAGTLLQKLSEWTAAIVAWHANLLKNVALSGRYLVALLVVPVFTFYFIADAAKIRAGFRALLPPDAHEAYGRMVLEVHRVLQGYVGALIIISMGTGVATIITLYLAGVSVYLTFGIMAGVSNLIPVVGPVIAGVLMCAITLLQAGWRAMLVVLAVYLLIQVVSDRLVAPKLMSDSAHLHPIVVIIALLVGAEFFGAIGLFVAVPVVAAARVAWMHYRVWAAGDREMAQLEEMFGIKARPETVTADQAAADGEAPAAPEHSEEARPANGDC